MQAKPAQAKTAVTVLTGFVGAGKTTILLHLLAKISRQYKVVILKNEYGDQNVDTQLVNLMNERSDGNISSVQEMINGCICCVLVGQLKNALQVI